MRNSPPGTHTMPFGPLTPSPSTVRTVAAGAAAARTAMWPVKTHAAITSVHHANIRDRGPPALIVSSPSRQSGGESQGARIGDSGPWSYGWPLPAAWPADFVGLGHGTAHGVWVLAAPAGAALWGLAECCRSRTGGAQAGVRPHPAAGPAGLAGRDGHRRRYPRRPAHGV